MSAKTRSTCRLCDSTDLAQVLKLADSPPANAFHKGTPGAPAQAKYPLEVYLCNTCGHLQLIHIVDPAELFRDYVYVSGTSASFRAHFDSYALQMYERYYLDSQSLVVDVGSNDGTLLHAFKTRGCRVLGVDPARAIAEQASKSGIPTIPEFFTSSLAEDISDDEGYADLVVANNVFAHADDLRDILAGVHALLKDDGVFVFEVGYALDQILKNGYWDNVYHEHLSYHTVGPLVRFLAHAGFTFVDAEKIPTHGGSVRCHAKRGLGHSVQPGVMGFLTQEAESGIRKTRTWEAFSDRINAATARAQAFIWDLHRAGRSIAGYGAAAKATTLLHHIGVAAALDFVVDDSPWKQGLYVPGTMTPVVSAARLYEDCPDYCLILASNFAPQIRETHKRYMDEGNFFVTPMPTLQVHPDDR